MRKDRWVAILVGGAVLVLAACAGERVAGLVKQEATAKNVCPPGSSGIVIHTGADSSFTCVPDGGQ